MYVNNHQFNHNVMLVVSVCKTPHEFEVNCASVESVLGASYSSGVTIL